MTRPPGENAAGRFITKEPDLVEEIAEEILRGEAWWVAARSGQYVVKSTVWADGRAEAPDMSWTNTISFGTWSRDATLA